MHVLTERIASNDTGAQRAAAGVAPPFTKVSVELFCAGLTRLLAF